MMAMASFLYCLLVRFWSTGANLPRTYQCGWSMLPHGEAKYWTRRRLSTNLPDEPEEGQRWSLWSLSPSFWCKSGLTSLLVLRTRQLNKQSRVYRISYLVWRLCPINLAGLHLDYILAALVSIKLHLTPSHREHSAVLSHLLISKVESTRVFSVSVWGTGDRHKYHSCVCFCSVTETQWIDICYGMC